MLRHNLCIRTHFPYSLKVILSVLNLYNSPCPVDKFSSFHYQMDHPFPISYLLSLISFSHLHDFFVSVFIWFIWFYMVYMVSVKIFQLT